jgi:hypothetical protein
MPRLNTILSYANTITSLKIYEYKRNFNIVLLYTSTYNKASEFASPSIQI